MLVRILSAGLRAVTLAVPRGERERWLAEWRSDLHELDRRGGGVGRLISWFWGTAWSALHFGTEDVTMGGWVREFRHAVRGLARRPGFAAVTVVTLALGIGANTAIFSVLHGVLMEELAYEDPGELVYITSSFPGMGFDEFWVSPPEYLELSERVESVASLGAYRSTRVSLGGGERPLRVTGAVASATLFETLGVLPELGRYYTTDEDGADMPVVVLSHELWVREFGADRGILGRSLELNGEVADVIGVMPPGFDVNDAGIEAWTPLGVSPTNAGGRAQHYLNLVGRLRAGTGLEAARAELEATVAAWSDENPGVHTPSMEFHPMAMVPLREEVVGEVRTPLLLLMGAVALVLLIACANVANLLLARAEVRQKEISVRVALGAGRGRLLQQFLVEGLLLAVAGAAVGTGAAWLFLEGLRVAGPGDIPRLSEIGLDGTVLAFTAAVALVVGVIFGLAPIRHLRRAGVAGAMREDSGRSTAGRHRLRLRSLLVMGEMALAVVLVIGSGLLLRSFQSLTRVDPGFQVENRLTFDLYLPPGDYPEAMDAVRFLRTLETELEAVPGVEQVAAMNGLPPLRPLDANDTEFEGLEQRQEGPAHNVDFYQFTSPDYLETMGIEVVRGRGYGAADGGTDVPVVLVNETLARTFYPGENPIGRRLRPCCGDQLPWLEIVGVVEDVKQQGLDRPAGTEIYVNLEQAALAGHAQRAVHLVVATTVPPASVAAAVREAVWRLDGQIPVDQVRTLDEVVRDARARPRFLAQLLGLFGFLALVLAAVGTYGVMSYSVEQRSREMGIRMALGAESGGVRTLVLRDGLGVALAGLAVGVLGALALSGVMESLLFGVAVTDPVTFVTVPLFLAGVAALACWIPAVRATRVDPVQVLNQE